MESVEHAKCRAYTVRRNDLSAEGEREDTASWDKRHQHCKISWRPTDTSQDVPSGCAYGVMPLHQAGIQGLSCYLRRSE